MNFESEFEGLVSFEEVSSYKLLKSYTSGRKERTRCIEVGKTKKRKKKKKPKILEDIDDQPSPVVEDKREDRQTEETDQTKNKRKRKMDDSKTGPNKIVKREYDLESMSEWSSLFTPLPLIKALSRLGFTKPTEIQRLTIPSAIKDHRDVVGAAETGSGKTLAFGIPIISGILHDRKTEADVNKGRQLSDKLPSSNSSNIKNIETGNNENKENEEINLANARKEETGNVDSEKGYNAALEEESDVDMEEVDSEPFSSGDEQANSSEGELMDTGVDVSSEEVDISGDESEDENVEDCATNGFMTGDELGCVKVVHNAKFDFEKETKSSVKKRRNKLRALIVTPTRELAVQIQKHLNDVLTETTIKTAVVIGGLSQQKQSRLLKKEPEIVIGTPGRLWEMVKEGNQHLSQISEIRYLAIDETDRMLEKGHFEELRHLLELLTQSRKRQTFILSATLTMIHNVQSKKMKLLGKRPEVNTKETKLQNLFKLVGITGKPKVVDVTRKVGTAEMLSEARLYCEKNEKDLYLYYFLTMYPGRTLVFCNSIDCVRRLSNLLLVLNCKPQSLHALKHQKDRLKNLERFSAASQSVLLATDVAARGLDIKGIDHIIHYEVPKTAEIYVHRSGRTARASLEGLSVILVDQGSMSKFRQLCTTLEKSQDLPPFPVNHEMLSKVRERVKMAHKLETLEYRSRKKAVQGNWMKKMSEEAGLAYEEKLSDDEACEKARERKRASAQIARHRAELKELLAQPIAIAGTSSRYPTATGKLVNPIASEVDKRTALSVAKEESVQHASRMQNFKPKVNIGKQVKLSKKKVKGFEKRKKRREMEKKAKEGFEEGKKAKLHLNKKDQVDGLQSYKSKNISKLSKLKKGKKIFDKKRKIESYGHRKK